MKKVDFSDDAKRARGVKMRNLDLEIRQLRGQIEDERVAHDADIDRFRARIRDAIAAFEDGRRGDGMSILRALARSRNAEGAGTA